ncbi:C1 family peptidase [Sphingomonas sp.]|uniref:C1 family peptidase n=1 Tax=Sphingomonas sp. TaxID=28214 RepID=UPI003B00D770
MTDSWNGRPLDGCLFEGAPAAAPMLTLAGGGDLPRRVDLRPHCSPVEDQRQTNSCVANAIVGALELHQRKAGMAPVDMSRLFLYWNARSITKNEANDNGSFIHHGMAAVLAFGVCEERMWPFEEAMVRAQPTDACFKNATSYEAIQFARTPRGEPAMAALAQGLPVAFGIVLPSECYQVAGQTGTVPNPETIQVNSAPSGHAMLIVGYDLEEKVYIVRNSWGAGYGQNGYLNIPFEVMERHAHPDQFWTIGAIEQSKGLGMFGPSVAESVEKVAGGMMSNEALDRLRGELRGSLNNRLETSRQGFARRLRE